MSDMKMYNILGAFNNVDPKMTPVKEEAKTETVYESVEPRGSIMDAVKSLGEKFAKFTEAKAKPDFLDVDKDGNKKEPFKKAVKDKKAKQVDEGQGPYELYNPKHPKFKANHDKWMKKNPGKKLADFIEAMKKKEATMNEAAYDEPAAPDAAAIERRKRLQALKDKREEEGYGKDETNTPIRKVAGKAYGGAAQKDDAGDLDEVAPPGAKAERMVKHIKKGYAKDGKLTKKEKGIAYATAWKAHNKGVAEGTEFKDIVANSKAELKKAKPAKLKESRVMEETDYFYEKIGKALAEKNSYLDTAKGEFVDAVRKEMVAQGIPPNRARNIIMMDEDFISDVATSYGHYCTVDAHHPLPAEIDLNDTKELDEIAKLAGLPVRETEVEDTVDEDALGAAMGGVAGALVGKSPQAAATGAKLGSAARDAFNDATGLEELTAPPLATPGKAPAAKATGMTPAKPGVPPTPTFNEEEVEEGNEFSGALAKAKASGAKEFEVDGKKYTVKEDINVNITANGQEDALNLFRKLAGMDEVAPTVTGVAVPVDAESAIAQGVVEPVEVEVDEERDVEHTNTPREEVAGIGAAIPAGADLNRAKKQFKKEYPGDNPMAVEESLWKAYESMINDIKE